MPNPLSAIVLVLAFVSGRVFSADYTLPTLRTLFVAAAGTTDEAPQTRFYEHLRTYSGDDPTVLGYRAAAEAMQARHVWNPLAKLRAVRRARSWFDRAVRLAPANAEIRFLRYSIERNLPTSLGLSEHLSEDRQLIMAAARRYPSQAPDARVMKMIRDFMLRNAACSPEEVQLLQSLKI